MQTSYNQHYNHRRPSSLKAFSIAFVFVLSIIGFYSLAPMIQTLGGIDDNTISILFRAFVLGGSLFILLFYKAPKNPGYIVPLSFMILLLLVFGLRAYENYFIENLPIYVGPELLFGFLIGASLIPALMAARSGLLIQDRHTALIISVLSIMFLIGLSFNLDGLQETNDSNTRAFITKVNAIALTNMGINFCLFYAIFFKQNKWLKTLALGIIPLCLLIIAYSKSRGPLIAIILTMITYFFLAKPKYQKYIIQAILGMFVFTLMAGWYLSIDFISLAFERFNPGYQGQNYDTVTGRQELWLAAWQGFIDDPLFGRYIFEQTYYHYPHNLPLEALMSLGILGGVLYLGFVITSFKACFTVLRTPNINRTGIFIALFFLKEFYISMFSGSIWGVSTVWISAAYLISQTNYLWYQSAKMLNLQMRNYIPTSPQGIR